MGSSVDESDLSDGSSDDDIVELQSMAASATDDVTANYSDWYYPDEFSDGEEGTAAASTERLRRQRRLAMIEALLRAAVDGTDDVEDWEQAFRARDELLEEGGLDLEHAGDDETERVLELWMEVLGNQVIKRDDRRVLEECHVCLEVVKLDKRACCGLGVCDGCMKKYVETQLTEAGVVRIGCPNPACDKFVFQEEVRELLRSRPELRDRYDRWVVDLNADPRRKTCPRCCRITDVQTPQPVDRRAGKYGVPVDCVDCQLRWCFACQSPWHEGLTCAKNRAGDVLLKRWARQRTYTEHNAQRCPKCKIYIQRMSGCDHMTCSRCKTKFCYRCGGRRFKIKLPVLGYRLEDHDKKYSIIGCNDRFDDNERLRRVLARGGFFGVKVVGALVAVPVICGVAGVALASLTVAAPVYGVYRLVKRVRRRSPSVRRYGYDSDGDWATEIDIDEVLDMMDPTPVRERFIELTMPRPRTAPDRSSAGLQFVEDTEETLSPPPPLPPRRPLYRVARRPSSPIASPHVLRSGGAEGCETIRAVEESVPPPPLPPRQPMYCASARYGRRPPLPKLPTSPHDAVTNELHESVSPIETICITHL